jgi:hypothetical protein
MVAAPVMTASVGVKDEWSTRSRQLCIWAGKDDRIHGLILLVTSSPEEYLSGSQQGSMSSHIRQWKWFGPLPMFFRRLWSVRERELLVLISYREDKRPRFSGCC